MESACCATTTRALPPAQAHMASAAREPRSCDWTATRLLPRATGCCTEPAALKMPSIEPRVSVVVLTYNRRDEVLLTLKCLLENLAGDAPVPVIVVDNGSSDGT